MEIRLSTSEFLVLLLRAKCPEKSENRYLDFLKTCCRILNAGEFAHQVEHKPKISDVEGRDIGIDVS